MLCSLENWRDAMKTPDYPFIIRELSKEDGGGVLIEFPDLPGCMSDGKTVEEAINNAVDAVQAWITVAKERDRPIPSPCNSQQMSGKWVQRVPKTLHAKLARQAEKENVSLNTLVVSLLSESLGARQNN